MAITITLTNLETNETLVREYKREGFAISYLRKWMGIDSAKRFETSDDILAAAPGSWSFSVDGESDAFWSAFLATDGTRKMTANIEAAQATRATPAERAVANMVIEAIPEEEEAAEEEADEEEAAEEDNEQTASRSVVPATYKKQYGKSQCNGDGIALLLKEVMEGSPDPNADLKRIARVCGIPFAWDHLNPGMQRMNLGNKIRHQMKRTGIDPSEDIRNAVRYTRAA